MKAVIVVLLLAIAALAFVFLSSNKSSPKTPPPPQEQVRQPQPPAKPQHSTVADEVNGVINYGIGATQLKAKKNMESKLEKAKREHDQALEAAGDFQ